MGSGVTGETAGVPAGDVEPGSRVLAGEEVETGALICGVSGIGRGVGSVCVGGTGVTASEPPQATASARVRAAKMPPRAFNLRFLWPNLNRGPSFPFETGRECNSSQRMGQQAALHPGGRQRNSTDPAPL